ncbi:hypothetical protein B0A58_01285 [Flavobacterium branchiophilum NBRC 15030 = ATCC 35035]|uniref:Uncharacterized protein DUF4159 n=1 Tax=Flavobacterium branchiophilum TaxID=55197 RepID=A0A543G729_9FLAO|nr:DUF4159 domain-containing protein [Flavobacterium branchiophilum]OXA81794.1 hypothetical protein B0A58_01285 [Flavobacterium branchiophilum NBRC 15030 = ATCC 35035]TQM41895.1 uncharacterized protein DUF4159 [Flavobacterium branchiophilum]
MKKIALLMLFLSCSISAQDIALLKYNGGGDWYANPTSLPNLIRFCNQNLNTKIKSKPAVVMPNSPDLMNYPFIHATGHGNIVFSTADIENLRNYLTSGGFLHIDDNYGMDVYIRKEIKKLFPNNELVELPSQHIIFQKPFVFSDGIPKIHEHDAKKPQAFGIFLEKRLVLLYTFETDLGDGWEDLEVHNDPKEVHEKALKMGANIIHYVFNN